MGCSCSGNCASCGGCAKELLLSEPEIAMLNTLGQIPFLPVARRTDDMTPMYLEAGVQEETSAALRHLEAKGLISIDYDAPLSGADMTRYKGYPIHGSMALTQRGQEVLELMHIQGIFEE